MTGGRHVLYNLNSGASKAFLFFFFRRLSPSASRSTTCRPISDSDSCRRYSGASTTSRESHGHFGTEERTPSTLEEFERLSEEKEESDRLCKANEVERRQGFVSQTVEKVQEEGASPAAASRDPKVETVKELDLKEPGGVGNFHRITGEAD